MMPAHASERLREAGCCIDVAARLVAAGDADGALTLIGQAEGCLADARAFVQLRPEGVAA